MELILVLLIVVALVLFSSSGALYFWLTVLVSASVVGWRAYRIRCTHCARRPITVRALRFCNQCGREQTASAGLRLQCSVCRKALRSELNLNFCNHCGESVPKRRRRGV